jgi:uncharacterized integral membrane protein
MENSISDINEKDILSVRLYRGGIVLSALSFVLGTVMLLVTGGWQSPSSTEWIGQNRVFLYTAVWMIVVGTGISVVTIHLYIRQFHALLKILYGIGLISVILFLALGMTSGQGFLNILYGTPYGSFGFGFVLATLCGIAVKEAFCFGRAEAILFAVVTPILVLGHIFHALSPMTAFMLLCADTFFVCIFAVRKVIMPVGPDIGDKSIYT